MDINKVILTGRIASEPTQPQVNQDGKTYQTFFSLAVQQGNNAVFFPIVYFFTNNQIFSFLKKGRRIAVEGKLHSHNQKFTIDSNRVLFLDKAPEQTIQLSQSNPVKKVETEFDVFEQEEF